MLNRSRTQKKRNKEWDPENRALFRLCSHLEIKFEVLKEHLYD